MQKKIETFHLIVREKSCNTISPQSHTKKKNRLIVRNRLFRFNYELKRVPQLTESQTEVTTHSRVWRGHTVFGSREEVLKMSRTTSNWNWSVMALRHFWCCLLLLPCKFSAQSWAGLHHEHWALWVWKWQAGQINAAWNTIKTIASCEVQRSFLCLLA